MVSVRQVQKWNVEAPFLYEGVLDDSVVSDVQVKINENRLSMIIKDSCISSLRYTG
jgi:hypothetical protein